MPQHPTALFADRHSTRAAVEQLAQAGFARDSISVVMSQQTHERQFGDSARATGPASVRTRSTWRDGLLGALLSSLTTVVSPGEEPIRVGGPLAPRIVLSGALSRALIALGLRESDARAVRAGLRDGYIVVGVQTEGDRANLAARLLELAGGFALQAA
jgi:class 3 adenylate cyclase